jgi:hypothetical protein
MCSIIKGQMNSKPINWDSYLSKILLRERLQALAESLSPLSFEGEGGLAII